MSYSSAWYQAFNVMLCEECKRAEKLIPKATAKALYLLSDSDVNKLGTISKANPNHKSWAPMKLYLQSQVNFG